MTTVDDVTLKQFVESTWFKGLARGAMILVAMASTYIGATLFQVRQDQTQVAKELEVVSLTQRDAANDTDRFQAQITKAVEEVNLSVDEMKGDVAELNRSFANVEGILEGMNRRDLAADMSPTWGMAEPAAR